MHISKPAIYALAGITLILGTLSFALNDSRQGAPTGSPASNLAGAPGSAGNDLASRVKRLEVSLQESRQIQSQLLELINEVNSKIDPEAPPAETRTAAAHRAEQKNQPRLSKQQTRYQRQRKNQKERLTNAGVSSTRADYILDKQERFNYEQMQLAYEFRHLENKSSAEARALQEKINLYSNPRNVLEQELSREEFDQYLQAYGGRSEFQVGDVLKSTPAYEAGLQSGDKIITYNNKRVFHMGDLRQQIYQVKPGETVAVEIQREGSSGREIIYLPSGPLGIRG